MRYLLLVMEESDRRRGRSPERKQTERDRMMEYAADIQRRGLCVASESLRSVSEGVRIAVRDGRHAVIDGPFAETKEVVGGFFLLECESKEQALAIATGCPAAEWATLELRDVGPCSGD